MARAAQLAAAAQPAWAATPHTERPAILRRAADIWLANAADIEWWGIGESGKIVPAMQFETHVMRGLDLARQIPKVRRHR